jgi:Asp-tRNA(Asn)/Glu-tRNA(Gln) amidotransferase A subunit family amidase
VLAGYDAGDPASVDMPVGDYTCGISEEIQGLRIGVPRAFFFDDLDPEVAAAVEKTIQIFRELGADIRDGIGLEVPTDRTLSSFESYAYHKEFVARSPELYQPKTLARIKSAEKISAADAARAKKELAANRLAIQRVFEGVDVLLTPTVPISPPRIAELQRNPENLRPAELTMLRNTRPFNVWGIPAISLPCGFTSDGMPIGLQLAGAAWREDVVLRAADAYERATEWHTKMPGFLKVPGN